MIIIDTDSILSYVSYIIEYIQLLNQHFLFQMCLGIFTLFLCIEYIHKNMHLKKIENVCISFEKDVSHCIEKIQRDIGELKKKEENTSVFYMNQWNVMKFTVKLLRKSMHQKQKKMLMMNKNILKSIHVHKKKCNQKDTQQWKNVFLEHQKIKNTYNELKHELMYASENIETLFIQKKEMEETIRELTYRIHCIGQFSGIFRFYNGRVLCHYRTMYQSPFINDPTYDKERNEVKRMSSMEYIYDEYKKSIDKKSVDNKNDKKSSN